MDGAGAVPEGVGAGAVDGAGAAAPGGTADDGGAAALTSRAWRGKLKLPPVSSITLTWQMYRPAVSWSRGTSKANATAPLAGAFSVLASTNGVSKTFVVP